MKQALALIAIIIFSFQSFSSGDSLSLVHNDLERIAKTIDQKAIILLEKTPFKRRFNLPGTPYSLRSGKVQTLKYRSLRVKIITDKNVPDYVKKLIKNRIKTMSRRISFEILNPSELIAQDLKSDPKQGQNRVPASLFEVKTSGQLKSYFRSKSIYEITAFLAIFCSGLFLLFGIYFVFFKKSPLTDIKNSIETSTAQIVGALGTQNTDNENDFDILSSTDVSNPEALTAQLKRLPFEGLKQLLFDAYWCHKDSYAAFIWHNIDRETIKILIENEEELYRYGQYLNHIEPSPGSYHLDPYYLEALELHTVDNKNLYNIIKNNLSWTFFISNIRLAHLNLSVSEQLSLNKQKETKDNSEFNQNLGKIKTGHYRELKSLAPISIKTIKDEEELLNIKDLKLSDKKRIVSWVWGAELDQDTLSPLFQKYSAQELASAWVGPEEVLNKFKDCLPEKKSKLMLSYLEKVAPTRQSWVYKEITNTILDQISEKPEQNLPEESEETKVA